LSGRVSLDEPDAVGYGDERRYKRISMFERGTLFRHAFDVLRTAEEPLTTREVVLAMLQARGVCQPTTKEVRALYGAVQSSLRNCNGKSVMRVDERVPMRWFVRS